MDFEALKDRLSTNAEIIRELVGAIDADEARWRPADGGWSILEIVGHLVDEERHDFRTRLDLTLHHPQEDWPPIDPAGWVGERGYQEQDLDEQLATFLAEREHSLEWLDSLASPDWNRAHSHVEFGSMTAGELLSAWCVHDLLHLRQLTRRRFQYTIGLAEPYPGDYAGEW